MKIIDMIGGFVKDYIKPHIFEKYMYDNIEEVEHEMSNDIFMEIISADYNNISDVIHLKKILLDYYGDELNKYNDSFYEKEIEFDENLHKVIDYKELKENILFDCGKISTQRQLQFEIKKNFNMPDWYGMNWDAFDDLIDLSHVQKIELKNFYSMCDIIHDDSLLFLSILKNHSKQTCQIIVK